MTPLPVVVEPDGALVALVDAARAAVRARERSNASEMFESCPCEACGAMRRLRTALAPFDPEEETK